MDIEGYPTYEIHQPVDVHEFYQTCLTFYQDTIEDANLLVSIAYKMTITCKESDERYILREKDSGKILLIAVRNKPLNVVVGPSKRDEYVVAIARYFAQRYKQDNDDLPGIVSSTLLGKVFMDEYFRLVPSKCIEEAQGEHLHVLKTYCPPESIPSDSKMELATSEDQQMLLHWVVQFGKDAGLSDNEISSGFLENMMIHRLSEKAVFLWKVPSPTDPSTLIPVSMIMKALCTESMYRIACVYTPAEYRGHHYATLLTSTLTHQLAVEGGHRCILFTDESNPVSNHIYEKIGYRIVAHHSNVSFQNKTV
jgi:hypothetical protein